MNVLPTIAVTSRAVPRRLERRPNRSSTIRTVVEVRDACWPWTVVRGRARQRIEQRDAGTDGNTPRTGGKTEVSLDHRTP